MNIDNLNPKVHCPRPGCGAETRLSRADKLVTHKLPDGWRVCAASGSTLLEAQMYDPPSTRAR